MNFGFFQVFLYCLALQIIVSSCNEAIDSDQSYNVNQINYTVTKEIRLPLDTFSQPTNSYFQLVKSQDTIKYIFLNTFTKSIYIYDFLRQSLIQKIQLIDVKKNRTEEDFAAFYFLNNDSIFLFPKHGNYFYLCDKKGIIYSSKLRFVDNDDLDKVEGHYITSSTPIIEINRKLFINNPMGWVSRQGDKEKFLLIKYNINDCTSEFFLQHPPSIYNKNYDNSTFKDLKFTRKADGEPTILYSFGFDPYVYEYNESNGNIASFFCGPTGFRPTPALRKNMSSDDQWLIFQTSFSFSNIIYDPYRKLLIRVILPPYNLDDIRSGEINPEAPKKPHLYLFDEKYQLLGEVQLDKNKNYYFINLMVTEDGFWIQKLEDNEDFLCYELITFKRP